MSGCHNAAVKAMGEQARAHISSTLHAHIYNRLHFEQLLMTKCFCNSIMVIAFCCIVIGVSCAYVLLCLQVTRLTIYFLKKSFVIFSDRNKGVLIFKKMLMFLLYIVVAEIFNATHWWVLITEQFPILPVGTYLRLN